MRMPVKNKKTPLGEEKTPGRRLIAMLEGRLIRILFILTTLLVLFELDCNTKFREWGEIQGVSQSFSKNMQRA
jgi:hypothetical protein